MPLFLFTLEGRLPLIQSASGEHLLQFATFLDVGRGWNAKPPTPTPETLGSVGVGILTSFFHDRVHANLYWGLPLNHVPTPNQNLQDHGLHLQFIWNLL